jgi:hypothetical protein
MPPSVVPLEQAKPPKLPLRVSFPRKRDSVVIGRRSGNVDARFRGRDTNLAWPKTQNALALRCGASRLHLVTESGDDE